VNSVYLLTHLTSHPDRRDLQRQPLKLSLNFPLELVRELSNSQLLLETDDKKRIK
jgi:hypothetical protein